MDMIGRLNPPVEVVARRETRADRGGWLGGSWLLAGSLRAASILGCDAEMSPVYKSWTGGCAVDTAVPLAYSSSTSG